MHLLSKGAGADASLSNHTSRAASCCSFTYYLLFLDVGAPERGTERSPSSPAISPSSFPSQECFAPSCPSPGSLLQHFCPRRSCLLLSSALPRVQLSLCVFFCFFICCSSGSSADLFQPRWKSASCLTMTIWAKDTFCTPSILKKKKPQERCLESDKFPASLLWLKTLFSFTLKHIWTPSPSPRSSDWVGGVFVYIRNSTERSASCRLHPGHRSWHVLPISNVSMMWFLFHHFCLLSCVILATVSPCFSLFFCYLCPLFIGVAPNHTITLIALFLIFSPHVQKCKMSLIFQIYFQQSSAKVTKNVRAEKASRGGSVWTLLLFKHSKAFYKPLSLFFFFFSTNQRRVANCAE